MTIDELIALLEEAKAQLGGGDRPVLLATQPSWPLAMHVEGVTVSGSEQVCWIVEGSSRYDDPYAPNWAWDQNFLLEA